MFRFENNVPEIYVSESRDFQLLCRLADLIYGGVKYEIDSIQHTANTKEINNQLLPLLKSKLGFFSDDSLTEEQLRYLLQGFPEIMRNKGSKKTIKEILQMWFRLNKLDAKIVDLNINDFEKTIILAVNMLPADTALLDELFYYVLPTGYVVNYRFGLTLPTDGRFVVQNELEGININNYTNANIYIKPNNNLTSAQQNLYHAVGLTRIPLYADSIKQGTGGQKIQEADPADATDSTTSISNQ